MNIKIKILNFDDIIYIVKYILEQNLTAKYAQTKVNELTFILNDTNYYINHF
jgi:hypothetical protein